MAQTVAVETCGGQLVPCGTIKPMNFGGESNSVSGAVEHTARAGASKSDVSLDESSVSRKAVMLANDVPA